MDEESLVLAKKYANGKIEEAFDNVESFLGESTSTIYIDGSYVGDIENGSSMYPYKTLTAAITAHSADTLPIAIHISPATYTASGDITLPNVPITVYGNNATISNPGHTITIPNPDFVRYNLFTTSNVSYTTFHSGSRCAMFGGGITGNIQVDSYCEFIQCQLNGGIVTVGSTGQCVLSICSPTSKFVSAGILMFNGVNMNSGYSGYLVNSTSGMLTMVNTIIYNISTNALAGAVSCDNGATTLAPNSVVNCSLITAGSAFGLYAGTAYTSYGKNNVAATNPIYGTHLIPVNTDIIGGTTMMGLGSDASGDLYYRNALGALSRLGIGTTGKVLTPVSGIPAWGTQALSDHSLTDAGNYFASMEPEGALQEVGSKLAANGRQGYAIDTSAIYGIVWDKTSNPTLSRVGALRNATVIPGVDTAAGFDDFESSALFNWIEETDTYGNVFIKIPKMYVKKVDTSAVSSRYVSRTSFDGSYLPKCFWDFTNSKELDYILVGKYKGSLSTDGLRLESKSGVFPLYNKDITQFRAYAKANNTTSLKGYQQLDIHVIDLLQTLFLIHTALLNSQAKVAGYTSGQYSASHVAAISEASVNRIIVVNTTAALYEVGQTIGIGTSLGGNQLCADRLITAIDTYDASNKAITFSGAAVTITAGNILYNMGYINGFSSGITSKFGSKISTSSGKHPFVWQGIESLYGDIWQFVDGVNINERQAWVCENAENYASNVFADPYKALSYVNGSTDGYITSLGYDPSYPFAQFPVAVGGSATTYYSDYYYSTTGQRIALVGGSWFHGSYAGLFYWSLTYASSGANLNVGGRLIKKAL